VSCVITFTLCIIIYIYAPAIIIVIITEIIFVVLSSWQSHCESSPGSFDECRLSAEIAANPQTNPTDLDCESARKKMAATVHIHHRHFIITQPES